MFSFLASAYMSTKLQFTQMKYSMLKHRDRGVAETLYQNDVKKLDETEKYEKSRLPESGYMTVAEYEELSRAKTKQEIKVEEPKIPQDENMVYVPQKTYKIIKYNEPVGSPELNLPRKLNFDRQINAQGIISGDKKTLIYPAVYYYAEPDCTTCDLFQIDLDTTLTDVERVMQANIIQKHPEPLVSTDKDISVNSIFRTLTPIDFDSDNKNLIIKEKIGNRHDGIWQTNLIVYNFETKKSTKLPEIRDAIMNYWAENTGIDFDEKRWDIYPMGYDSNDENRIIVCAYAFTGDVPKFLGTWSIDNKGTNAKLESLENNAKSVSVVGYRLVEDSVKDISEVEWEAKLAKKEAKAEKKSAKIAQKEENKIKKLEYQRKIKQMDIDTIMQLQERRKQILQQRKKDSKVNQETNVE